MTAKAIVGGLTAFLGLLVAREVPINPFLEASLVGAIAFFGVYVTPNSKES